jgi:hypothetical protein
MKRFLPTAAVNQAKQNPGVNAPRLVPDLHKSDDMTVSWSGGYSYREKVAMERDKWPSKEQRSRTKKNALDYFYSRMHFMHQRRRWEQEKSTSRDPLFRCGVGAPVMRQRSTEIPSVHALQPIASVKREMSAPLGRTNLHEKSQNMQVQARPGPPLFFSTRCIKSRIAWNASTEMGRGNSTTEKRRPAPLFHKGKRLPAQLIWDGIQGSDDSAIFFASEMETRKRSIADEPRTLFDLIDTDASGTLEQVSRCLVLLKRCCSNLFSATAENSCRKQIGSAFRRSGWERAPERSAGTAMQGWRTYNSACFRRVKAD